MATDWARYLFQYKDVYKEYSDGGKWTWDKGRQANAYMRADGTPLLAETAAQYAQNHYRAHGKRAGRKIHSKGDVDYAAKLRARESEAGSGNSGGNSGGSDSGSQANAQNDKILGLQKQIADLIASMMQQNSGSSQSSASSSDTSSSTTQSSAGNALAGTILSRAMDLQKKKKSFLTPLGA